MITDLDTTGWWNAANCLEAVENAIVANNGQSYLDVISNTCNLNAAGGFLNDYYDDEGWLALAWIRAYDLTGNIQYLSMAKTIFKDMTGGWDDHCDGGLGWRKSRPSKNAVQNELFLLVAIRLHQRTPGDDGSGSYFEWAIKEWDWFKHSGLINSQNLVNDGLDKNCQNNGRTTWTYNQGVIIGGLTELYKTTGDSNYLAQATAIADATISTLIDKHGVLREPCESGDCGGGGDTPQFKGIFIRYLACLYDETHNPAYLDFLLNSARSVWANDRDDTNHLGLKWSGPFEAQVIGVITVVCPDGAGAVQQEIKIRRIMRFIIKTGEVTDKNSLELRRVAAAAIARFTRFPQNAVLVNQRGDGGIGNRCCLGQVI